MYNLIPYTTSKNIQAHTHNYIFLLSVNHGNAHLGLVINGYGFISPENFRQSTKMGEDAVSLYKTLLRQPYKEMPKDKIELSRFANNLEKNIRNFKVVLCQSNPPLNKNKIENLRKTKKIDRIKFTKTPHRLYICGIEYVPKLDSEELHDYLQEGSLTRIQFFHEHIRRQIKDKKKKFAPHLLNPFETLECLTHQITNDTIEYQANLKNISCLYGAMQHYTPDFKIPKKLN